MIDRVSLQQAEDKEPETEILEDKREQTSNEKPINEMQDLQELSVILGFEHGFDGNGELAEKVYSWARDYTGEPGGPKVIGLIKDTAKLLGTTLKGPQLLQKLSMYVALDSKQSELQLRKENLIL